jgi:hypothetical protein
MPIFSPRPSALRCRPRSLIDVALDPAQREAVSRPTGGTMLVLGEAGHGKTTVALHRLAHLYRAAPHGFRARVIVPNPELEQMLAQLVTRLGLDVRVQTYDRFARAEARRVFGDIPRRESVAVAPSVQRMKRSAQLFPLVKALAARPPRPIDDDFDAPKPPTQALAHRADLQHLFGDGDCMRTLARALGLGTLAVDAILEHTHVQFLERSEQVYAHVDRERLYTLDSGSLDAGTPLENSASIDVEDYAVLFEIDRQRALRGGVRPSAPRRFDCLVLDEAQELAPLELRLIARCRARGGTLVVAGDADQQTDNSASFETWQKSMRRLRAPAYDRVELEIGYRCPREVAAFARTLRSEAPSRQTASAGDAAAPTPALIRFASARELYDFIASEAKLIERRDPTASFCIIARSRDVARAIAAALRGQVGCKLVLDEAFTMHRGVDVTTVDHVKGLEFDYVVVPDLSDEHYPANAETRRALYVAVTRTRHQLALAYVGQPSALYADRPALG